jgi:Tfp pilus assembly protein PilX
MSPLTSVSLASRPASVVAATAGRHSRGFVLPVVLVMLLLMTITVIFLMRRGTVDERIAFNVRQVTTLDTATQFALRTCERLLWVSPPGVPPATGNPTPPRVVTAPASSATAAWRDATNWSTDPTNGTAVVLGANATEINNLFGGGIDTALCLYEDAQAELSVLNDSPSGTANALLPADAWRKYRITAEVVGTSGTRGRAQTEVRLAIP